MLRLSTVALDDSGLQVRAMADNGIGSPVTSNVATLTVEEIPPVITYQSTDVEVGEAEPVRVFLKYDGAPTPLEQWERSDDGGATWVAIAPAAVEGNPGQREIIGKAVASDNGAQFRATLDNGVGSPLLTAIMTLTVQSFEAPTFVLQPESKTTTEGVSVLLRVTAAGVPEPAIQWETSSDGGATWENWIPNAPGSGDGRARFLVISTPDSSLNGRLFRVRLTNPSGEAISDIVTLTVKDAAA